MRKITDEREALGREIARLTEQKEQKDAEYEQTVAKLWGRIRADALRRAGAVRAV